MNIDYQIVGPQRIFCTLLITTAALPRVVGCSLRHQTTGEVIDMPHRLLVRTGRVGWEIKLPAALAGHSITAPLDVTFAMYPDAEHSRWLADTGWVPVTERLMLSGRYAHPKERVADREAVRRAYPAASPWQPVHPRRSL